MSWVENPIPFARVGLSDLVFRTLLDSFANLKTARIERQASQRIAKEAERATVRSDFLATLVEQQVAALGVLQELYPEQKIQELGITWVNVLDVKQLNAKLQQLALKLYDDTFTVEPMMLEVSQDVYPVPYVMAKAWEIEGIGYVYALPFSMRMHNWRGIASQEETYQIWYALEPFEGVLHLVGEKELLRELKSLVAMQQPDNGESFARVMAQIIAMAEKE